MTSQGVGETKNNDILTRIIPMIPFIYLRTYEDGQNVAFTLNHNTGESINVNTRIPENNIGCLVDTSCHHDIRSMEIERSEEYIVRITVTGYVSSCQDSRNDTEIEREETWRYYEYLGWINEEFGVGDIHFDPCHLIPIFNAMVSD